MNWINSVIRNSSDFILFLEYSADLSGDAPEQPLALVAVGGRGGTPEHKVVGGGAGDGVDQRLQRLLVHVHLLQHQIRFFLNEVKQGFLDNTQKSSRYFTN